MAKRRVLIVDDSKTAQIRLRKMLDRFDIEVDTVFSAEEALGYLSYRHPLVIFLDHHLEGMDGLEALRIIKSNPSTALIPIIMYTSERGDSYVAQARALGALDILSKDVIQFASLEKVLGTLNITARQNNGEKRVTAERFGAVVETPSVSEPADLEPVIESSPLSEDAPPPRVEIEIPSLSSMSGDTELDKVHMQVSRLFELHIAKVRQEIEDSTKFLTRRLSREIQEKLKKPGYRDGTPADLPVEEELIEEERVQAVERGGYSPVLMVAMMLSVVFVGYQMFLNSGEQSALADKLDNLSKQVVAQDQVMRQKIDTLATEKAAEPEPRRGVDGRVLLDALGWAVNVNTQTPFGTLALSDKRIYVLGELLSLLKAANFSGGIYLDIHAGNFCVVEGPSGQWMLPEPESNIEDCVFFVDVNKERLTDDEISVGFLNYMNSTPVLTRGVIDVNITAQAYSTPKFSYPALTNATSAGAWNEVALKNNRIEFSFAED